MLPRVGPPFALAICAFAVIALTVTSISQGCLQDPGEATPYATISIRGTLPSNDGEMAALPSPSNAPLATVPNFRTPTPPPRNTEASPSVTAEVIAPTATWSPTATPVTPTPTPTFTATPTPPAPTQTEGPTRLPVKPPTLTPSPTPLPLQLPAMCDPAIQFLTHPADGEMMSVPVEGPLMITISGTAFLYGGFEKYDLHYRPPKYEVEFSHIVSGTEPVQDGSLAEWDARAAFDSHGPGWYLLRLRVVDTTGNWPELGPCYAWVHLDGE